MSGSRHRVALTVLLLGVTAGSALAQEGASSGSAAPGEGRPPELLNQAEVMAALEAHYPPGLRDRRISGHPVLRIRIDRQGNVSGTEVGDAGGHRFFAEAAEEVARVMRFAPATQSGRPVPITVALPVGFNVEMPPELEGLTTCEFPPTLTNRQEIERVLREHYPPGLRDRGISGEVLLTMAVDSTGTVWNTHVERSSGQLELDQAALVISSFMEFEPGREDRRATSSLVRIPVAFRVRR